MRWCKYEWKCSAPDVPSFAMNLPVLVYSDKQVGLLFPCKTVLHAWFEE